MARRSLLPLLGGLAGLVAKARSGRDDHENFAVRSFTGPSRLVDAMEPLRVAHLTDLHVGPVTPMAVQHRAVELALLGQPDLVALTGDFVCHDTRHLDALADVLGRFDVPVVAVLGNHDHWCGADEVRRTLRRANVLVLDNASTVVTLRGQALQLVGLDDAYTGHADVHRATRGLDPRLPTLGLSHIAEEADALWAEGVPLVLSGHTHAGQITVAGLHELLLGRVLGHRYVHGHYGSGGDGGEGGGSVYVGAGIGAGVVPVRAGERGRREVAFFELGRSP